jgi:hypothetical protein
MWSPSKEKEKYVSRPLRRRRIVRCNPVEGKDI